MGSHVASSKHPHEPEIPPALDSEGRCLVCGLLVDRDALRRERDDAHAEIARKERLLQMIVDDNHLLSRADDWERLAVRHSVTARAALRPSEPAETTADPFEEHARIEKAVQTAYGTRTSLIGPEAGEAITRCGPPATSDPDHPSGAAGEGNGPGRGAA